MSGPLDKINTSKGDTTHLRDITAPKKGDEYINSYYKLLAVIEQDTVYVEDTQDDLPDDPDVDWSIVGIAETESVNFSGDSVHIYDGSEWVDTFQALDQIYADLNDRITRLRNDLEQPEYVPVITSAPSEIEVDETIEVKADITNGGRDSGTQSITLEAGGTQVDSKDDLQLGVSETKQVTLSWTPDANDVGGVILTVKTADRTDSRSSKVLQPATFLIDSVSAPDSIDNDSPATISATIRNSGEVEGTKTVSLEVDGTTDSKSPTLSPGQSNPVDLEWGGTTATGTYTVTISTPDDTDSSETIEVLEPADFEVASIDVSNEVDADVTETISATINNVGASDGKKAVHLDIDGSSEDTDTVTIDGNTTGKNVDLEWNTPSQGGDHTVTVRTDGTSLSGTSTVLKAELEVTSISTTPSNEVNVGNTVDIDATVQNTGNTAGNTTVSFEADNADIGSDATGTVSEGDTATVGIEWDSSGYNGNVTLTATADGNGQSTNIDVFEPGEVLWSFDANDQIRDPASVANGTVYFGDMWGGTLYAVDTDTGNEEWSFRNTTWPVHQASVVNGTTYVSSDELYALDADTGNEKWSFEVGSRVKPKAVEANGTVFFGASEGTYDGSFYAVDADTGNEKWSFDTSLEDEVYWGSMVVGGTVFFGDKWYDGGKLYALDVSTGNEEWSFGTEGGVDSSVVVDNGTVYFADGEGSDYGSIIAVDASTGNEEWSFRVNGGASTPAVLNDTVYFTGENGLYAVDASTGNEEWFYSTTEGNPRAPTVVDGTVFVGSSDSEPGVAAGHLYAVDADTGNEEWTAKVADNIFNAPTVVDGIVFIGSFDETFYAVWGGVDGSSEDVRGQLRHDK